MQGRLSDDAFLEVVDRTPLVAIDLVIRDSAARILVGLRMNEPAKGSWFVPGGRVLKGETLDDAFARISLMELGVACRRVHSRLIGLYTHLYDTNFLGRPGIGTHYVVMAHEVSAGILTQALPTAQHGQYRWCAASEAEQGSGVHPNVLPYFAGSPNINRHTEHEHRSP